MLNATKRHLPLVAAPSHAQEFEPLVLPSKPFAPADMPLLPINTAELANRNAFRTSSYVIYVDLPGVPDEMLLVHGYTGAYDRVSKRIATYLRAMESKHAPKPLYGDWTSAPTVEGNVEAPSDESISVLKRRGYLVPLSLEEEEGLFSRIVAQHHLTTLRRSPSYILMPTYQCNLRCHYCFQDHMRTNPEYSHLLRMMDRPMIDRIIRGMKQIDQAHGVNAAMTRNVTFFGGEPLLAELRPTIEYMLDSIVALGKTRFFAVTNATDLHVYRDLLSSSRISMLQITLDGPPDEHDKRRIYPDGKGSFSQIADNITMALECGVQVSVRMNVDSKNIHHLPRLAEEFITRGWTKFKTFAPYAVRVAPTEKMAAKECLTSWQLTRALDALENEFPNLSKIAGTDDSLQAQARATFDHVGQGSAPMHSSYCGAHTGMYVIDAFADIYACWERTGDPDLRIGHIAESGDVLMNKALLHKWRGRNAVSNPVCRKCRYAASCGGGCAVGAEEVSGDSYNNFCDGYANRFRASVAKAYLEFQRGERTEVNTMRLCDA
ncbi:MAG TPA: radical SAM protein [Polyangium sp.]|nr:radical SAM protein [Polyangium sp.]